MTRDTLHLYGPIEKFDPIDGGLLVTGIASTEDVDNQGDIITADAMRKALPEYLRAGTVREMHQPIAAGKPVSAYVDDDGRTHLTAKIVDASTIEKIKQGVLKGFSIGGKALKKVGSTVNELMLRDVSVVDVPCNSQCVFEIIKFDAPGDHCNDPQCKNHHESATKKCSSCMAKEEHAHIEKCGSCGHEMQKCSCSMNKSMSAEALQKIDALTKTVEALTKSLEGFTALKTQVDELKKSSEDTLKKVQDTERAGILAKMDTQGRVPFKPEGVAYTLDELQKMDLPILKVLAANAPVIPTQSRTIFKGDQKAPAVDPNLKGSAKIEKAWEHEYGNTLDELYQRTMRHN